MFLQIFSYLILLTLFVQSSIFGDITIVGAGLSGLTAAHRLNKEGHTVEIYEARGRPGGRAFTVRFGDSWEELGGKFLDCGNEASYILALMDELGIETITQEGGWNWGYVYQKKALPFHVQFLKSAPEPTDALFLSLKEQAKKEKSLGVVLDSFFGGFPELRHIIEVKESGYEGLGTHSLSTECLDTFWEFYNDMHDSSIKKTNGETVQRSFQIIKGGNSSLVHALLKSIENRVHYHHVLKKIEKNGEGKIVLTFNDNKKVTTDCVIITIPFSILRDVEVQEGLFPEDQWDAIKTISYGTNSKILIPTHFRNGDFTKFALVEDLVVWFNNSDDVMTLYYGGNGGLFNAKDMHHLKKEIKKQFASFRLAYPYADFPKGLTPTKIVDQQDVSYSQPIGINWSDEEFSKGSYSCIGVGQEKIFTEMSQEYGQPIKKAFRSIEGKIFFAGEHTTLKVIGTLEGAVESGERAAQMVMERRKAEEVLDIVY